MSFMAALETTVSRAAFYALIGGKLADSIYSAETDRFAEVRQANRMPDPECQIPNARSRMLDPEC